MKKFLLLAVPFFLFSALFADPHAELEAIARGGAVGGAVGGGVGGMGAGFDAGRVDSNANFDNYGNYNRDQGNLGGAYYGGYGTGAYGGIYNNGYLAPGSAVAPNDDMNQLYQNNLNSMERTGH